MITADIIYNMAMDAHNPIRWEMDIKIYRKIQGLKSPDGQFLWQVHFDSESIHKYRGRMIGIPIIITDKKGIKIIEEGG